MADDKVKKLPWGLKPESLKPSSMKVIFKLRYDKNSLLILFHQSFFHMQIDFEGKTGKKSAQQHNRSGRGVVHFFLR